MSCIALAMWLDGDRNALMGYLAGHKSDDAVRIYFERAGLLERSDLSTRF